MDKQWWHNKIAYQIYPKSFLDSNGDGIGDLPGITSKLDYLKDLGVDIIWMSPMFQSPCKDQGYDISDYYQVDPVFGTMADMEELLAQIKKRDMHLLLDLVINHCSSQHQWFQNALADPHGPYGDYFYLKPGVNGGPPNNWRSYFGGSAWEPVPNTDLYYLHLFHKDQPDLNFENPVVRQKIYAMINWWLDKGVDGFRIDAIANIKKDLTFQSYPPDRDDGLVAPQTMVAHATGLADVLMDLKRHTFDKHNAFTVAELFNYDAQEIQRYIGADGCFSTIFEFDTSLIGASPLGWYDFKKPTPEQYKQTLFACQRTTQQAGLLCNIIENHDEPRGVSRYLPDTNDTSKKMLATAMMLNRGLPFLFQGQEIGMENTVFTSMAEVNDIHSHNAYQVALQAGKTPAQSLAVVNAYSRDNGRTPMQWSSALYGGFSTAAPWLGCNPQYGSINVEAQLEQEDSVLHYYKKLIALRKNPLYEETLVWGAFAPAFEQEELLAYTRVSQNQTILVVCNFQNKGATLALPHPIQAVLLSNYPDHQPITDVLALRPYEALVLLCN